MKAVWARSVTAAEDAAICTFDFGREDVDAATAASIAARFTTYWNAIKGHWTPTTRLDQYRFYNGYDGDGSPGEVDHIVEVDLPGESVAAMLPPQCAMSVTEEVPVRRSWGRFYLPAPSVSTIGADGRYTTGFVLDCVHFGEILYEGWQTDERNPIVWVDTGAPGKTPVPVEALRGDDIVDIQRRRRWDQRLVMHRRVLL